MRTRRSSRTISTWVVVCALLLGALMPALMRGTTSGDEVGWRAICSSVGFQWTGSAEGGKLPGGNAPAPGGGALGDHCPWCSLHTVGLGLPPVSLLAGHQLALRYALPPLFFSAPRTRQAWTSAQPRAPPQIS